MKITLFADPLKVSLVARDLERITRGSGPSLGDLNAAPVLVDWHLHWERIPVLTGVVAGHPERRDGLIMTSQLFALDLAHGGWARTMSRWYSLRSGPGVPLDG